MRELVEQHAAEEEQRADDGERRAQLGTRAAVVERAERVRERPSDQREDEDPTHVDGEVDAEQRSDAHLPSLAQAARRGNREGRGVLDGLPPERRRWAVLTTS